MFLAYLCPYCGDRHDTVHAVFCCNDAASPNDGDFNLCSSCGEWTVFDSRKTGGLRRPDFVEHHAISTLVQQAFA
jgi:hypothetical protein